MIELLPKKFIEHQTEIISIIAKFNKHDEDNDLLLTELGALVNINLLEEIKARFLPPEEPEIILDKTQPSILLTSVVTSQELPGGKPTRPSSLRPFADGQFP